MGDEASENCESFRKRKIKEKRKNKKEEEEEDKNPCITSRVPQRQNNRDTSG
jgi:hypothetical protein